MPGPYTDKKTARRLLDQGLITPEQYTKLTGETVGGALDLTSLGQLDAAGVRQLVASGSITPDEGRALESQVGAPGNPVTRFLKAFNPLDPAQNRRVGPVEFNPALLTLGLALASGGLGAGAGTGRAAGLAAGRTPATTAVSVAGRGAAGTVPTAVQTVGQRGARGVSSIRGRALGAGIGAGVAGGIYGATQANRAATVEEQLPVLAQALGGSAEETQVGQAAQGIIPAANVPETATVAQQAVDEAGRPYRIIDIPGQGQFIQFASDVFDPNTGEVVSLFGEAQRLRSPEDTAREQELEEREFGLREMQARIAALPAITQFAQAFASPSMRLRTLAGAARLQEQIGGTSPFATIPGTSVPASLAGLFGLQGGQEVPLAGATVRGADRPINVREAEGLESQVGVPTTEQVRTPQLTGVPNLAELSKLPAGEQDILGELFNIFGVDTRDIQSQFGQTIGQPSRRVRGLVGGR